MAKLSNEVIDGQVSIFDCETKENKITDMQQKTIDKVLGENTGTEVFLYESGVVGVIADDDPEIIIPQGDISKAFKPKETRKTYLIREDGYILAIAVGEERKGERIKWRE
ncbi:hypothetical protein [uncultured Clostridium sp.]|uniref:hypothetical protein n=1 Tax=uncultured Clostridium sp. TaxID=59620 RepID=UPI0025CEAF00|nr:hypothetical protein [uncultured Clostridium sp.]MDU4882715.1 hypothetical protein [Clostridium celatum]MDU7076015.1 hypothetical protein [Clostridium celatum]